MPNPRRIPRLLNLLKSYPSSATVQNPYSVHTRGRNLESYLEDLISHPYSGDLLVGEAPGHRGCALTGIPFTSEELLASGGNPFLVALRPRVSWGAGVQTEQSATCVLGCLSRGKRIPAFWNAFPFHPHDIGNVASNREPNAAEVAFGLTVLDEILQILTPDRVFAVGRVSEGLLNRNFPVLRAKYIRHPARGGHGAFNSGMAAYEIV